MPDIHSKTQAHIAQCDDCQTAAAKLLAAKGGRRTGNKGRDPELMRAAANKRWAAQRAREARERTEKT